MIPRIRYHVNFDDRTCHCREQQVHLHAQCAVGCLMACPRCQSKSVIYALPSHCWNYRYPAETTQTRPLEGVTCNLVTHSPLRDISSATKFWELNAPRGHNAKHQNKWQNHSHTYESRFIHTHAGRPFEIPQESRVR